jgi:hypothetical protein
VDDVVLWFSLAMSVLSLTGPEKSIPTQIDSHFLEQHTHMCSSQWVPMVAENYENKHVNKLTPEFGFVSNRRWEEQEKTKLPELTGAPTHDCRLM